MKERVATPSALRGRAWHVSAALLLPLWGVGCGLNRVQAAEPPAAVGAAPASAPAASVTVPRPSAQAALDTLLSSPVGRANGAAAAAAPAGRHTAVADVAPGRLNLTVNRGQTLDQILRQHLANSPLRVEVLRDLTRQLNPQAFAAGAGHRLLAGARLQLPSVEDQVQHAFGRTMAAREADAAGDGSAGGGAAAAARKGWVRYP